MIQTKLSKEDKEFRKAYYSNPIIKERLLKAFSHREITIMDKYDNWKCQRGFNIQKIDFYDYWLNFVDLVNKNYNLYLSVAKYKYIPYFDMNPKFRSTETSKFFEVAYRYIESYDIFLDFDISKKKDFVLMKQEVLKCIEFIYFEKPLILTSGNGIQLMYNSNETFENVISFMEDLKKGNKYKFLCNYGIKLLTRFRKCEYSLNETIPVLLLKPYEILGFSYDEIKKMSYHDKMSFVINRIKRESKQNE
jgi:hypothetical protein